MARGCEAEAMHNQYNKQQVGAECSRWPIRRYAPAKVGIYQKPKGFSFAGRAISLFVSIDYVVQYNSISMWHKTWFVCVASPYGCSWRERPIQYWSIKQSVNKRKEKAEMMWPDAHLAAM